jgi:hypothetical protein
MRGRSSQRCVRSEIGMCTCASLSMTPTEPMSFTTDCPRR